MNGVILSPTPYGRWNLQFDWSRRCWVKIESYQLQPSVHTVSNDQVQCAQLAVRRALELGYKRIGLAIREADDEATNRAWASGFLAGTERLPKRQKIPLCIPAEWSAAAFLSWYHQYKPDVVLSIHVKILDWLKRENISVPGQIGFIDLDLKKGDGSRAGIVEDHQGVGATAVDILTRLIQQNELGLPKRCTTTSIGGAWVDGATVTQAGEVSGDDQAESLRAGGPDFRRRGPVLAGT